MDEALWIFNIVNTFFIFKFMDKVYGFRFDEQKYINVVLILAFYFIHTFVNLYHNFVYNVISEILLINISAYLFFKPKQGKFYFNSMYQFYLIAIELMTAEIISYLTGIHFTKINVHDFMMLVCVIEYTIVFFTYKKVIKLFQYDYQLLRDFKTRICVSIIMILQFVFLINIGVNSEFYLTNIIGIIIVVYIIIINTGTFYIIFYDQRNTEIEMKEKYYDYQYVAMYDILQMRYTMFEKMQDIVCNHLQKKRPETELEIKSYLKNLREQLKDLVYRYECGNEMMNILVNTTIIQAEMNQIKLQENVDVLNWEFIQREDITLIFGNLMFNATEITKNLEIDKREMEIYASRKGNFVVLKVINTCNPAEVKTEEENTKVYQSDEKFVRVRTNIILETIKKVKGEITFDIIEDKFMVTVNLPLFAKK